jgi:hypothetical protein
MPYIISTITNGGDGICQVFVLYPPNHKKIIGIKELKSQSNNNSKNNITVNVIYPTAVISKK